MSVHPQAGKPAPAEALADIPALVSAYYTGHPDTDDPSQWVSFGTSGHRGCSLAGTFNEDHIAAICQAIVEYRREQDITGPLFIGRDTHALSEPALATAIEVFAANGVEILLQPGGGFTPTPAVSHAILRHNRGREHRLADGIVITPSHNPPEDGGFKYNPPNGGPAGSDVTRLVQARANELMVDEPDKIRRVRLAEARARKTTRDFDFVAPFVDSLDEAIDMEAIRASGIRIGVDPLGGAGLDYWDRIRERFGLELEVVNRRIDPAFGFMCLDRDGKIRMDCSSPFAMASLIGLKDDFDIAFGNDPDNDRHGIVTPGGGLMNPNHYLAVCIDYLFRHRPDWPATAAVGKTLVSSSMIDRVAADLDRRLVEVPVGFKWFVDGLLDGSLGFGGEESAGAAFLDRQGRPWSTDKDGILLNLLAAEITAVTGRDPARHYADLEARFGSPVYQRIDAPADRQRKEVLANLSPEMLTTETLAGDPIRAKLTRAPGNDAEIGGLKVVTDNGWFAARPSGTEDIYKLYAESFAGQSHLGRIQEEAQAMIDQAFAGAGLR